MNFDHVTEYLDSLKEQFGVRCTDCIVLKNHIPVYRHLTGTMDYNEKKKLTEDNLHDIFSASKVFTMIAVMQLVEQGKIALEDELSRYLPEFAKMSVLDGFDLTDFVSTGKFLSGWPGENDLKTPIDNKILIHQMMSMTAGFSYNMNSESVCQLIQENPHAGTREIVKAWANSPLFYVPGTRYSYSYAHDILAAVVEVVSGQKFSEYMKKNIFEPLNVDEIYYQIPGSEINRLTDLYGYDVESGKIICQKTNPVRISDQFESGGGGIACTVEAYSKVLDILANDGVGANGIQILKPESIAEMSKNRLNEQQLADFHIGGKHEYGYGLGVRTLLDSSKSKSPLGEFGWDGAAGAYVLADPKNHLAIFYVQAAPESGSAFSTIHPTLRDMIYDVIEDNEVI